MAFLGVVVDFAALAFASPLSRPPRIVLTLDSFGCALGVGVDANLVGGGGGAGSEDGVGSAVVSFLGIS